VGQPITPWGLHECLGVEAVLPYKYYQVKEEGMTSTPERAFGVVRQPGGASDLTLWTPWSAAKGNVTEDYQVLDYQAWEWASLLRGECCGLRARLFYDHREGMVNAKIQCIGAPLEAPCRLIGFMKTLFVRPPCMEGTKCIETETSQFDGIGECVLDTA